MKKILILIISIILIIVLSFFIFCFANIFDDKATNTDMLNTYLYNTEVDSSLYINDTTNKVRFSDKRNINIYKIQTIENNLIKLDNDHFILIIDDVKVYCSLNQSYMFKESDNNE